MGDVKPSNKIKRKDHNTKEEMVYCSNMTEDQKSDISESKFIRVYYFHNSGQKRNHFQR